MITDGEVFLPIANKLNALNGYMAIMTTDTIVTAGTVTSIPVTTLTQNLLKSGDVVHLVVSDTGVTYDLTLTADAVNTDTAIAVSSVVITDDIPAGSYIYFSIADLLTKIF